MSFSVVILHIEQPVKDNHITKNAINIKEIIAIA
jgi:hypothetical protein